MEVVYVLRRRWKARRRFSAQRVAAVVLAVIVALASAVPFSEPVEAGATSWAGNLEVESITSGNAHSCGISGGQAYCWGDGSDGRLGNNSTSPSSVPVAVSTAGVLSGKTVTAISAGTSHTCAVADGAAYCWGAGTNGRLGHNSTSPSSVPVAVNTSGVLNGRTVTDISAGTSHTCAVADGLAFCWGDGTSGKLGNNSTSPSSVPVAVNTSGVLGGVSVSSISAGDSHSCAVASGAGYCWGLGTSGRLGNNSTSQSNVPVAVNTAGVLSGRRVTDISAGTSHTCAVADSLAFCWGPHTSGRVGNNTDTGSSSVPVAVNTSGVLGGKAVTDISAGSAHSCAVATSAVYCWGLGSNGRLGNNDNTQSNVPVATSTSGILSGTSAVWVSAGTSHTCAIASGQAYCWGLGTNGRLGYNDSTDSFVPVAVHSLSSTLGLSSFKWYENANSASPGAQLAGTNGIPKLSSPGDTFRLRQGVNNGVGFSQVATGDTHSCGVANGAVYCWGAGTNGRLGNNSTNQSIVPVAVDTSGALSGKTVTALSVGTGHTCVIAAGEAYCWGLGTSGQLGNNAAADSSVPVAVDTSGILSGKKVTAISAGNAHTCAVADGAAYCWGLGTSGRLGNNGTSQSNVPVAVDATNQLSGKTVTAISAGNSHSCAVANNAAFCWGLGTDGRLGNASTSQSNVPVAVSVSGVLGGKRVTAISAGSAHSCAVASGAAYCWGLGTNGRVGNNSTTGGSSPIAVYTAGELNGKTVTDISAGTSHSCAIADNAAYCWGLGTDGRNGHNSTSQETRPVAVYTSGVFGGKAVRVISAGTSQSCAVADNLAFCWGLGTDGRLGDGLVTSSSSPVYVNTVGPLANKKVTSISAGGSHSCAVADGAAYCWGVNTNGQLGDGSTNDSPIPVAVSTSGGLSGKIVTAISAGESHTCAVASGAAYCWGLGTSGRLGNNSTAQQTSPVAVTASGVLSGKTITAIGAGSSHSCAVGSGAAYCWGLGSNGRLGNSSTSQSNVPVAVNTAGVLSGKTITAISAGDSHSCAIGSGAAYCWGLGTSGRLGNNSTSESTVPVTVDTTTGLSGKTVTAISAGVSHTCAVASGVAYCWGPFTSGRVGNNTASGSSSVPVAVYTSGVLGGKVVTDISAGSAHSCAVAGNAVYCWGLGGNGRLGNNDNTQYNVPVLVHTGGVMNGKSAVLASAGTSHSCAVASDTAYCWGFGANGRLGNNDTSDVFAPSVVYAKTRLSFTGPAIPAAANTFILQYASRSAQSCLLQTTGFATITSSTPIAYNDNAGVANGAAITTSSGDPTHTTTTVAETYRDDNGTFTTVNDILPGKTALFDFSLKDNGATANTPYCIRIAYSSGSAIESAVAFAEIIMANGVLLIDIVDGSNAPVATPSFAMNPTIVTTACQSVTGTFGTSSQRLRIYNTLSLTGWSTNIAATNGATAKWQSSGSNYDFNDQSGSPAGCNSGSDGDGIAGRLSLDPSISTITPQSGCTTTGLSKGSAAGFSQGTVDAITLLSASSLAGTACFFQLTGVGMQQYIPANQPAGSYSITMTVTLVAQ